MSIIEIRSISGREIWKGEASSMAEALKLAIATGANLTDANLTGANLDGANLTGAAKTREEFMNNRNMSRRVRAAAFRGRNPNVPMIEALDRKILAAIEAGGSLDMGAWHSCETTHCRAGWAITLAGEAVKALEKERGPFQAGRAIYIASTGRAPHFFATNERALADIKKHASE